MRHRYGDLAATAKAAKTLKPEPDRPKLRKVNPFRPEGTPPLREILSFDTTAELGRFTVASVGSPLLSDFRLLQNGVEVSPYEYARVLLVALARLKLGLPLP